MAADKRWLVISARPSDDAREAVAEGLLALGGSAVHEHDGEMISYFPPPEDLDVWLALARASLRTDFAWRWQDDEDWSQTWKRGLQPRRVGRHFVVAPSWTEPAKRAGGHVKTSERI